VQREVKQEESVLGPDEEYVTASEYEDDEEYEDGEYEDDEEVGGIEMTSITVVPAAPVVPVPAPPPPVTFSPVTSPLTSFSHPLDSSHKVKVDDTLIGYLKKVPLLGEI